MQEHKEEKVTIFFIDDIPLDTQNYLRSKLTNFTELNLYFTNGENLNNLSSVIHNADILIGWRPTFELLEKAENMKLFINPGAGVRHLIELFRAVNKKRNVLLANGHGNSYFVAQHAVALLLSLMNKIILHHDWMKQGKWRTGDEDAASIPLRFRKVGLLGYGSINQKVHKMLAGFDIEFYILRKHWEKQTNELITPAQRFNVSQLHDFLKVIDILIIALPSTSVTEGLLGLKELTLLGTEGLIVNVARGEIIDELSLYTSLKEGYISGAAIDVWYNNKPQPNDDGTKYPYNYPFHNLQNMILSPHRGYSPFSDLLRWNEVIENITRMVQKRNDFINLVDLNDEY